MSVQVNLNSLFNQTTAYKNQQSKGSDFSQILKNEQTQQEDQITDITNTKNSSTIQNSQEISSKKEALQTQISYMRYLKI